MVAPSFSAAFVRVAVLVLLHSSFGDFLTCQNVGVHKFVGDSCVHIRHLQEKQKASFQWASEQCEALNEYPTAWRLPQLDTMTKNRELHRITFDFYPHTNPSAGYWIGLMRDQPKSRIEIENIKEWADEDYWRWTWDNTTLFDSFRKHRLELWNGKDPNGMGSEYCVFAYRTVPNAPIRWFDSTCDAGIWYPDLGFLVCESVDVTPTTTTTTTTEPTRPTSRLSATGISPTLSSGERVDSSDSQGTKSEGKTVGMWIGIGLAVFAALLIAVVAVACLVKRRRRKGVVGWRSRERGSPESMFSADSQASGPYENARPYKKGVMKKGLKKTAQPKKKMPPTISVSSAESSSLYSGYSTSRK